MKRMSLYLFFAIMLSVSIATIAFADSPGKMDLKVGDEIYACNCGEGCDCKTLSRLPGKCGCGNDLVKATVVKIEDGMAYLQAEGWKEPRAFKTTGKYACACGAECKCHTISQKSGKCGCGTEMKEVK
jgi:hypothetical protein